MTEFVSGRLRGLLPRTRLLARNVLLLAGLLAGWEGCAPVRKLEPSVVVPATLKAGQPLFGKGGFIELVPGDLPIILTVPHGGSLVPEGIPDRQDGVKTMDSHTQSLARAISEALETRTGRRPHLVQCNLRRTKVDVNRDLGEAAQGNGSAEWAWKEYHAFTEAACRAVAKGYRAGLVLDLHAHGHAKPRTELGYLLRSEELNLGDAELNQGEFAGKSSIRCLAAASGLPFASLLRGPKSLGAMMEARGFAAVPSPSAPGPGPDPYFAGGYHTRRHTSAQDCRIIAIQAETPFATVRRSPEERQAFANAMADSLLLFLSEHYDMKL